MGTVNLRIFPPTDPTDKSFIPEKGKGGQIVADGKMFVSVCRMEINKLHSFRLIPKISNLIY